VIDDDECGAIGGMLKRAAKLQVYKTLIGLVATYGAETWTLTVTEENALKMFERKIIRKIYGK
jgi:hypothetical protein